ncbi:hypothetical protein RMATCC62417_07071 [Rhizopus microsporus]|nr:hypothetical protein RMATCC62417_07071 [Rhizopus microsporus]
MVTSAPTVLNKSPELLRLSNPNLPRNSTNLPSIVHLLFPLLLNAPHRSDSETDPVSHTRPPSLKQPRPNTATFMEVEKPSPISRSTPVPPFRNSSLDQTLKATMPAVFAKALRDG